MSTDSRAIEQRAHSSGKSSLPPPGPPPPTPSFIFRGHDASIQALEFFASNTFLVSGDQEGWICVWDIWKRRQVYKWQGHPSSSILAFKVIPFYKALSSSGDLGVSHRKLGALEKQVYIVSHGRDNEIHVWDINTILQKSLRLVDSTAIGGMTVGKDDLTLVYSLPVNALNFCKMSILAIEISAPQLQQQQQQQQQKQKVGQDQERSQENESSSSTLSRTHHHIYIAVPSPMTPSLIDVYDIVRPERAFVSIGSDSGNPGSGHDMFGKKWGSAMAIQLIQKRTESLDLSSLDLNDHSSARMNAMDSESRHESGTLCMLVGYEDGLVILFQEQAPMSSTSGQKISGQASKQNRKMNVLWSIKCHREPVLALDISSDLRFAVSSGADNMLVKYELFTRLQGIPEVTKVALKANGIADIKIRNDNKILGLAGWDGRLRVFSAKTLKPLAVLKYHRESLDCIDFASMKDHEDTTKSTATEQGDALLSGENNNSASIQTPEISPNVYIENDGGEDSESTSEEDSDEEDALKERRQWSRRHWVAVGGKENRISLWEIY